MGDASQLDRAVAASGTGAIVAKGVRIQPMAPRDRLHLAVARPSLEAVKRVEARLGFQLPRTPSWIRTGDIAVYALGPRAWLLESESLTSVRAGLGPELRADGVNAAEASDTLAAFQLTGERVVDLLATGCAIDLHPDVFQANACARTLLARVDVVLTAAGSGFEVRIDRSLARYLWSWFANAAIEFGTYTNPRSD